MKIIKITLQTSDLPKTISFYNNILELPIVRIWENGVTFQVGNSHLTFIQETGINTFYHVAFRTNSNHFDTMYKKLNSLGLLLPNEEGNTSMFWKGKQLYFLDPSGNVFEILERINPYDNQVNGFYDICEVGIPSHSVEEMSQFLKAIPDRYHSNSDTFRFFGDELGVCVLVKKGRHWYPTDRESQLDPLIIEVEGDIEKTFKHPIYSYTIKIKKVWNKELPVFQVRMARPTDKWEEVNDFYGEKGLGLKKIGGFQNHNAYDGVMFGLPEYGVHLEFTHHVEGSPCPAPTKDNLLVLYMLDKNRINEIITRLELLGTYEVEPDNPYWLGHSHTFEDPDGWRIVLCHSSGT